MNLQMFLTRISLIGCTAILLYACSKKPNTTNSNTSDNTTSYSYDFYWENDYPNAQSLVVFKTKDVPAGAALTW